MSLEIIDMTLDLGPRKNATRILTSVSMAVPKGEVLGLAGESGSGKTMTGLAILDLLPAANNLSGKIIYEGHEVFGEQTDKRKQLRGTGIGMVFQDPSTSLHPQLTILSQLTDHMRKHLKTSRKEAKAKAIELLREVDIDHPERMLKKYPHQFSGGQRQRIAIAMALACEPNILIADEPTTALDVTTQANILHLLQGLVKRRNLSVIFITHDLGVLQAISDQMVVMQNGSVVEQGLPADVLFKPQHEYTRKLVESLPDSPLDH